MARILFKSAGFAVLGILFFILMQAFGQDIPVPPTPEAVEIDLGISGSVTADWPNSIPGPGPDGQPAPPPPTMFKEYSISLPENVPWAEVIITGTISCPAQPIVWIGIPNLYGIEYPGFYGQPGWQSGGASVIRMKDSHVLVSASGGDYSYSFSGSAGILGPDQPSITLRTLATGHHTVMMGSVVLRYTPQPPPQPTETTTGTDTNTGTITQTTTGTTTNTETGTEIASLSSGRINNRDKSGNDKEPPDGPKENPQPVNCPKPDEYEYQKEEENNTDFTVKDPVNIPSGNFTYSEIDLALKSRLPIKMARIYNSIDTYFSPFGRGWNSPYVTRLDINTTQVIFINSDGARTIFRRNGNTFTAPEGVQLTLALATDTGYWSVARPEGTTWTYDADGKILQMANACCGRGAADAISFEYDTNERLHRVTNPSGQWLEFSYDANGLVTGITDSTGRSLGYGYDQKKNLTSFTDVLGRTTNYAYDDKGYMTQISQPGNRVRSITYADGRVTSVTAPDGEISSFTWDINNRCVTLFDPKGTTHTYQFNSAWKLSSYAVSGTGGVQFTKNYVATGSLLTGFTDSLGKSKGYSYYPTGKLGSFTDALGNVSTYEWHATTQKLTKKTDSLGRVWQYAWCSRGNLIKGTDPLGGITTYTYDSHNNRISRTDQLGRVTRWVYDSTGNYLLQAVDPLGNVSSFTYDARGNLVTSSDQLGRTAQFQYDATDRLTKTVYPDGRFVEIEYDDSGNVKTRKDQLGRTTSYTYDAANRPLTVTRPDGTALQYAYNSGGQKVSETDALGRITRFEYNAIGMLTKTIYPDSSYETFNYDTENRLIGKADELGNTTSFEYDAMGRMLVMVDPTGAHWESTYDAQGRKVTDKDPLNRERKYQFDALDRVIKITNPDTSVITNAYDTVGNLLNTVDALGKAFSWEYDVLNRQIKAVQPNGASTTTAFDAAGQVIAETDALGRVTRYSFDNGGRRTTTTDALGNVWQNSYDNAGRLIALKDPMGAVSSMTYDIMDRLVSQTDPLGNLTSFEFDNAGRRIAKTDPLGHRTITTYDLRDRVTAEVDPEGHTVSYAYDAAGRREGLTDGANRAWRWEYDQVGRVTAEIDPFGNAARSRYDAAGNRNALTNARGQTTNYQYDLMNRLTQVTYADGSIATLSYDLNGRELARSSRAGLSKKTYDTVGNLTSETIAAAEGGNVAKKWQYEYDAAGNKTKGIDPDGDVFTYRYDALNRLTSFTHKDSTAKSGQTSEIAYQYDAVGRLTAETKPGMKTTNSFDAAGRLIELKHEKGQGNKKVVAARKYTYSAVGNRLSMQDETGGTTRYSYNNADWLTKVIYPNGEQVGYAYNGAGDREVETSQVPTVEGRGRNTRLGTFTLALNYSYDQGGRMIARASDTFQYDDDGNLISSVEGGEATNFDWSTDNRLIKVSKEISCEKHRMFRCRKCTTKTITEGYTYEPESWRRLTRKTGDDLFVSTYDGDDEGGEYLVKENKHHHGWKCLLHRKCNCKPPKTEKKLELFRQFIGGPGTDDIEATKYRGRYLWHAKDGLGSTIALTNRGGNAITKIGHDAWGNLRFPDKPGHGIKPCRDEDLEDLLDRFDGGRSFGFEHDDWHFGRHFAKVLTPFLFQGRRWDGFSQTYNNRWRQYAPKFGRFVSADPLSFDAGNNLYAFANLNPTLYTDPFGLMSLEEAKKLGWTGEKWIKDPTTSQQDIENWQNQIAENDSTGMVDTTDDLFIAYGIANSLKGICKDAVENLLKTIKNRRGGWKYTEPKLPPKKVVEENGVEVINNLRGGEHGPAHLHVKGGGPETRIGQGGKPLTGNPELTPQQRDVIENNKGAIRKAIDQIQRWWRYENKYK